MKIDHQHAKCILNSARPQSVDAIVLAKSASKTSKNAELKSLLDAAQKNMNTKEIILIAISTEYRYRFTLMQTLQVSIYAIQK